MLSALTKNWPSQQISLHGEGNTNEFGRSNAHSWTRLLFVNAESEDNFRLKGRDERKNPRLLTKKKGRALKREDLFSDALKSTISAENSKTDSLTLLHGKRNGKRNGKKNGKPRGWKNWGKKKKNAWKNNAGKRGGKGGKQPGRSKAGKNAKNPAGGKNPSGKSAKDTWHPTLYPTLYPTIQPTLSPTFDEMLLIPTLYPTLSPTLYPSKLSFNPREKIRLHHLIFRLT